MPRPNTVANFWKQVTKSDGCWIYTGMPGKAHRYPSFGWQGKKIKAHRFSWWLAHGDIPAGMEVCHKCDVTRCVRPDHLFVGTHHENMLDLQRKGYRKAAKGSRNGFSKLSEEDVLSIRRRYDNGARQVALAAEFNVYQTTISRIVLRKQWQHI